MSPNIPTADEVSSRFPDARIFYITSAKPTELYIIGGNTLEELAGFVNAMDIHAVFVEKMFIDKVSLRITDTMFKGLPLNIIGGVQFDSHRFNRDLESMDLSAPVELRIFALYEGRAFGVHYTDGGLDSVRRISPEERVSMFAEERSRKLRSVSGMSVKTEDPEVERFSDILIRDRGYRELENDEDRFNYVLKIARRPGNDSLKKAVQKDDGGFSTEKIRKVVRLTVKKTDFSKTENNQMVFDGN